MAETKFKVGDFVRVVGIGNGDERFKAYINKIYKVQELRGDYVVLPIENGTNWHFDEVELYTKGQKAVVGKLAKFALQYELDQDLTEYFATIPEVKARIKELASRRGDLKLDKIFIHTLSKTQKVELGTSIVLRKA